MERIVADIDLGRCRGPRTTRAAFPGPESCPKIRKPTFRIDHFRGRFFSPEKGASARLARCHFFSRFRGTCLRRGSRSSSSLHALPPERRPGPLQSNHISPQRPCSSTWPWKVFIAEAEPFADKRMRSVSCTSLRGGLRSRPVQFRRSLPKSSSPEPSASPAHVRAFFFTHDDGIGAM